MFSGSIVALQKLNALGYGKADSGLVLNLVYNPQGPSLPPAQVPLEDAYRGHLRAEYGVEFNRLFTLANMPIAALRLDADLEGAVQRVHDAAPGQLSRGEPRAA